MNLNGVKVVDANCRAAIIITTLDVRKGGVKSPSTCAAARACMRELGATQARVHLSRTYLMIKGRWVRYITPSSLRSEIVAFDRGGSFEPGEYVLTPPRKSTKLGYQQGSKTNQNTNSKRRRRGPIHTITGVRHHGLGRHITNKTGTKG